MLKIFLFAIGVAILGAVDRPPTEVKLNEFEFLRNLGNGCKGETIKSEKIEFIEIIYYILLFTQFLELFTWLKRQQETIQEHCTP